MVNTRSVVFVIQLPHLYPVSMIRITTNTTDNISEISIALHRTKTYPAIEIMEYRQVSQEMTTGDKLEFNVNKGDSDQIQSISYITLSIHTNIEKAGGANEIFLQEIELFVLYPDILTITDQVCTSLQEYPVCTESTDYNYFCTNSAGSKEACKFPGPFCKVISDNSSQIYGPVGVSPVWCRSQRGCMSIVMGENVCRLVNVTERIPAMALHIESLWPKENTASVNCEITLPGRYITILGVDLLHTEGGVQHRPLQLIINTHGNKMIYQYNITYMKSGEIQCKATTNMLEEFWTKILIVKEVSENDEVWTTIDEERAVEGELHRVTCTISFTRQVHDKEVLFRHKLNSEVLPFTMISRKRGDSKITMVMNATARNHSHYECGTTLSTITVESITRPRQIGLLVPENLDNETAGYNMSHLSTHIPTIGMKSTVKVDVDICSLTLLLMIVSGVLILINVGATIWDFRQSIHSACFRCIHHESKSQQRNTTNNDISMNHYERMNCRN